MAEEEVPAETKKAILEKFFSLSPPGEFNDVEKSVRKLVCDDELVDSIVEEAQRKYNEDQLVLFDVEHEGKKFKGIVSSEGRNEDGSYSLPTRGVRFEFDQKEKKPTSVESDETEVAEEHKALCEGLLSYVDDAFFGGASEVYASSTGGYNAVFSGAKFNARNMWNGRWKSRYEVKVEGEEVKIDGEAHIVVHYYEDGNVQLDSKRPLSASAKVEGSLSKAFAEVLRKAENSFHNAVFNVNSELSESAFKDLRRQLPINKQKFDWDRISMHKLAKELPK